MGRILALAMRSPWLWAGVAAGVEALVAALGGYGYMMQRLGGLAKIAEWSEQLRAVENINRTTNEQITRETNARDVDLATDLAREDAAWPALQQ